MQTQLFQDVAVSPRKLRTSVCRKRDLVRQLLRQWHGTLPPVQGWRVAFIASFDNSIVGVSTWGRPVARYEDQDTTLEHNRMALAPDAPRNTASWFLANNREWIRENMPQIKRLISYVDLTHHTGVTYRADNWRTIYYGQKETGTWGNRAGHTGRAAALRTKFEREP